MSLFIAIIFLCFASIVHTQQCSYVTVPVCGDDDVSVSPGRLGGIRGPKGDSGHPGKMGPLGRSGRKGDKGEIGPKGETAIFDEFQQEVRNRLDEIERKIARLESCATSTNDGYQILRNGKKAFCNNGWTVFQRRFNGSVDFYRNWQKYKEGFGNLNGEFWLGLEKIHNMMIYHNCRLRINLGGFDGTSAFAEYSSFLIDDESDNYRLHVGGYSGTAGDSLINPSSPNHIHNGMQFSTKDRDNDNRASNCAQLYPGAWWFNSCFASSLNANWGISTVSSTKMIWSSWKGFGVAIKKSLMMLKCD